MKTRETQRLVIGIEYLPSPLKRRGFPPLRLQRFTSRCPDEGNLGRLGGKRRLIYFVLLCFESAVSGCFSHLPILRDPDTFSCGPHTPYACICGGLSAGYAPRSDVYSSQGHQSRRGLARVVYTGLHCKCNKCKWLTITKYKVECRIRIWPSNSSTRPDYSYIATSRAEEYIFPDLLKSSIRQLFLLHLLSCWNHPSSCSDGDLVSCVYFS